MTVAPEPATFDLIVDTHRAAAAESLVDAIEFLADVIKTRSDVSQHNREATEQIVGWVRSLIEGLIELTPEAPPGLLPLLEFPDYDDPSPAAKTTHERHTDGRGETTSP